MDLDTHRDTDPPVYDFGYWPELAGVVGVLLLIAFLFTFARGFT